jgi:DNA-binding PadR family transcriptional regulator
MRPFNYAILKYFTTVEKADADQVMDSLKKEYSHFKSFKKKTVIEALMTAEANGLLEETGYELDDKGELRVYYHAPESGAATINTYIKN